MKTESLNKPHRSGTVEAYQRAVVKVVTHMRQHLDEPLDLDHLARIAAISKFHLVRVFDELTGATPHHFLACLRIQRAKELLLRPEANITEVCMQIGYASLGSFSKTFSSLVGVSPQEFRALPKRLSPLQFARAVWSYLAADNSFKGAAIEGSVEGYGRTRGFIFVGSFTKGVPQGVPFSGTVLLKPGDFRIERPKISEFHLLAALIPFSAGLTAIVTTLPVGLVASLRVHESSFEAGTKPVLCLRPLRPTDPPIVLALPGLPPWRGTFTR